MQGNFTYILDLFFFMLALLASFQTLVSDLCVASAEGPWEELTVSKL